MPTQSTPAKAPASIAVIGIDIGKNVFHLIGMQACVGAHLVSRQLIALGSGKKIRA